MSLYRESGKPRFAQVVLLVEVAALPSMAALKAIQARVERVSGDGVRVLSEEIVLTDTNTSFVRRRNFNTEIK